MMTAHLDSFDSAAGLPGRTSGTHIVVLGDSPAEQDHLIHGFLRAGPVEVTCSGGECVRMRGRAYGRDVVIVTVPDFTTELPPERVAALVVQCVQLSAPGPHAFLVLGSRHSSSKRDLERLMECFGRGAKDFTMILRSVESGRFLMEPFNGHDDLLHDGDDLLSAIEGMVERNGGSFYQHRAYEEVRRTLRQKEEQLKRELRALWRKQEETLRVEIEKSRPSPVSELRLVLVGKAGAGKSASGNTILRNTAFRSELSGSAVTQRCEVQTVTVAGKRISVVDTPGVLAARRSEEEIMEELERSIRLCVPGPHAFLLVLKLGRFTQEEKAAVDMVARVLGDVAARFTVILFTFKDDFEGFSIQQHIHSCEELRRLVERYGNRYHIFNNTSSDPDENQVTELFRKIEAMVSANGNSCYTMEMYRTVHRESGLRSSLASLYLGPALSTLQSPYLSPAAEEYLAARRSISPYLWRYLKESPYLWRYLAARRSLPDEQYEAKNISLTPGGSVTIEMKIRASAREFEVSLGEKEEDLALHFKSQFSGLGSRTIVLNSRREGRWQSEQRYSNFPFQQGTDTKVVINFSASGFEVELPDGQKLRFPNRQGFKKLTYMSVKGHIRVKSLKIQ